MPRPRNSNLPQMKDSDITSPRTSAIPARIPLVIGFANLSGDDLSGIASEDEVALAPLFSQSRVVPAGQVPSAHVLFVYTHLNMDGTIKGTPASGIRQIVQATKAAILVLASANSQESLQHAAHLPGPKTANIVLTLDRNGAAFSRFFQDLFVKMRGGTDMLSAWVELAPQVRHSSLSNVPATLLLAEAGKLAFPK